jgi:hypothetical protein
MNIATNRMTLESIKPANALLISRTPVTHRPTQTIIDVRPSGIFSVTNITMANARNRSVIVAGLMIIFPSLYINFIFQRVMIRPGFI